MNDIMKKIKQADKTEIDILLDMAMKRKRELYPDWEIIYYAHKKEEADELVQLLPLLGIKYNTAISAWNLVPGAYLIANLAV